MSGGSKSRRASLIRSPMTFRDWRFLVLFAIWHFVAETPWRQCSAKEHLPVAACAGGFKYASAILLGARQISASRHSQSCVASGSSTVERVVDPQRTESSGVSPGCGRTNNPRSLRSVWLLAQMSRQINNPVSTRYLRRDGRRDALQRLDEHLERTTTSSNSEIIRLMRQAMFADVDELEKSGKVIIPK